MSSAPDPGETHPEAGSFAADGYVEDEPRSPKERQRRAADDVARLTRYGVLLSASAAIAAGLAAALGVPGASSFAPGLAIGCATATLNLRVLARAGWDILSGRVRSGQSAALSLLRFLGSFLLLTGAALWLTITHQDWLIGFGIGLSLPAFVGVLYGVKLSHQD